MPSECLSCSMENESAPPILIENLQDLKQAAFKFAPQLRGGDTVGLSGELGAGKTTFMRFLAEALGAPEPVSSPSYVLCHEYSGARGIRIEHWDLYRVKSVPEELLEPATPQVIRCIEWFERFQSVQADCVWKINLAIMLPSEQRQLHIEKSA